MKFFDRTEEIERLRQIEERSQEVAQFTVITGRRRIGKTELIKKAYEGIPYLYFFVARKTEADLCSTFMEEISYRLKIPHVSGGSYDFASVFKYIMEIAKTRHITLFIDEFQDFIRVKPAIFSEMQDIWDRNKSESRINLIVAGSVNSLMNRLFRDEKESLFGRHTSMMTIRPFRPSVVKEIMEYYSPGYSNNDLLALYALTGGVAKYLELFVDNRRLTQKQMLDFAICPDSYFISEGKNLLVEEFGKEYGKYFSILTQISQGKNTRSEIESAIGSDNISGYLYNLNEEYGLISKRQPLFEKSANRNVHYAVNDQFLRFWFRFIHKYIHVIEAGGYGRLRQIVDRDFSTFTGYPLECWFREKFRDTGMYTRLGYWHDRKGENEIDLIAEDEMEKRLEICEVKRSERNIDLAILRAKADNFFRKVKRYSDYQISYRGLSTDDM